MKALRVKDIVKTFDDGEVIACNNISLEVEEGEFFVLLGPSGCGKSTLLRTVAGLEHPDSGEIYIKDDMILDQEPAERAIAMMFQRVTLYPHLNVYDNVAFPLKIQGMDKDQIDEKVNRALELMQIMKRKNANVDTLSGGEAQRAMMARVLVQEPEIFLLDEPFSALDHQLRVYMRKEILRIHRKTGVTILFVTHNQEEAMRLGDRLAIMNDGIVEQVGTPKEILREPKNKFVAEFIGHPPMNFIPADLTEENNEIFLNIDSSRYGPLDKDSLVKMPERSSVTLGLRPEELRIEKGEIDRNNLFTTEVEIVEDLGTDTFIHFDFGGVSVQADVSRADLPETEEWKRGEKVSFGFEKDVLKIFDENGERVK